MSYILKQYGVNKQDKCFFCYSFGPYLGCWLAWEAAKKMNCLCIPGGGMHTLNRLQEMRNNKSTILFCTPTYAIYLHEIAQKEKFDLQTLSIRMLILAGEPGASELEFRKQLHTAWPKALIYDHYGMTELGPLAYQCPAAKTPMLHIVEEDYYAEIVSPNIENSSVQSKEGELVVTSLKNKSTPLLRYCTGDYVRWAPKTCSCKNVSFSLVGGVIGRVDDMLTIRGVNIFPSTIDAIIRTFPVIIEHCIEIKRQTSLVELYVKIELALHAQTKASFVVEELTKAIVLAFDLRVNVIVMKPNELNRFDFKACRWHFVN